MPLDRVPADQPVLECGSTGISLPRLGFGTWQLDDPTAHRMVAEALDAGIRHVDTAQMYGNEGAVGAAIAESDVAADEVFVTTKIDNDCHDPADLRTSLEASLDRLGLDEVDLTLVHWPVDWDRMDATIDALGQSHADGLTRHIGVSNFTVEQLDAVADRAPLSNLQVECHPFHTQDQLRTWCRDRDWAFTAYSPLAQGDVLDDPTLVEIGRAHGAGPVEVAIAWLLHLPGVVAIPRTADPAHLRDNWGAKDITLDESEIARITALDQGRRTVDPGFAPWN
jgi:diketogulonate reductase-like aldo/keto reductase